MKRKYYQTTSPDGVTLRFYDSVQAVSYAERYGVKLTLVEPEAPKAPTRKARKAPAQSRFERLYNEAHEAGMRAYEQCVPTPIRVVERFNPLDDRSPIVRDFGVHHEGLCGFAWVRVSGRSGFGRWALQNKKAIKGYPSGVDVWVRAGQSYERKMAYAQAFAAVLQKHGIECYADGRLD